MSNEFHRIIDRLYYDDKITNHEREQIKDALTVSEDSSENDMVRRTQKINRLEMNVAEAEESLLIVKRWLYAGLAGPIFLLGSVSTAVAVYNLEFYAIFTALIMFSVMMVVLTVAGLWHAYTEDYHSDAPRIMARRKAVVNAKNELAQAYLEA